MSTLKLKKTKVGSIIKLAYGVTAYFHSEKSGGKTMYYLLSNFWKLDGSRCAKMKDGYTCSWVSSEEDELHVTFDDPYSDIFQNPKLTEVTDLHIKRAGCKSLKELIDLRAKRKTFVDELSPDVKRYTRCCYTGKPILKKNSISTHHGDCSNSLASQLVQCNVSGDYFIPKDGVDENYLGIGWVLSENKKYVYRCTDTNAFFVSRSAPKRVDTGTGLRIVRMSEYEKYSKCDECGIHYKGNGHEMVNDRVVCSSCITNAVQCADCGMYFFRAEDSESCICDNCIGEPIKSYSSKFKNLPDYGKKLMFGVEIEFEIDENKNRTDIALKFKRKFGSDIMIKSDGSLNYGFEVVTKPMEFMDSVALVRDICEFSRDKCKKDADTTGIHVHASKASLKNKDIINIIAIFSELESDVVKIARRKSERWSKITKCKRNEIGDEGDFLYKQIDTRYRAVNLQNDATVEFRVFKGTTNKETAVNYILFVASVIEAAKKLSVDDFDSLSLSKVLSYVSHSDVFKPLFAYTKRIGCLI